MCKRTWLEGHVSRHRELGIQYPCLQIWEEAATVPLGMCTGPRGVGGPEEPPPGATGTLFHWRFGSGEEGTSRMGRVHLWGKERLGMSHHRFYRSGVKVPKGFFHTLDSLCLWFWSRSIFQLHEAQITRLLVNSDVSPKHRGHPYRGCISSCLSWKLTNSCQTVLPSAKSSKNQPPETSILVLSHCLPQSSKTGKRVTYLPGHHRNQSDQCFPMVCQRSSAFLPAISSPHCLSHNC